MRAAVYHRFGAPAGPVVSGATARVAAVLAATLLGAVAAEQTAVAAGRPWGEYVYGGRAAAPDGTLPVPYRVGSASAAVLLPAIALS